MVYRPVALLDVDRTLVLGSSLKEPNSLNEELLTSLHEHGIMDIYIFSDMLLSNILIERLQLVKILQQRGFVVHGVIIPSDVCWDIVNDNECDDLVDYFIANNIKRYDRAAMEKGLNEKSNLQSIQEALNNYCPKRQTLGQPFNDASDAYNPKEDFAKQPSLIHFYKKSLITKAIADCLSLSDYKHPKGLMLDLFIMQMPEWVSSIVCVDDDERVIKTIQAFKPKKEGMKTPPITIIPVPSKREAMSYYDEHLEKHFKHPVKPFIMLIKDYLKDYKPGEAKDKIAGIEVLMEMFWMVNESFPSTIIGEFLKNKQFKDADKPDSVISGAKLIAGQRNFFLPKYFSIKPTHTEKLIHDLLEKAKDFKPEFLAPNSPSA